jgi:two-component system LytT family sensor kinase
MKKTGILLPLIVNTLITIVVTAGLSYNDPRRWVEYLFGSFVFSNCIGFSIYGLVRYVGPRCDRFPIILRLGSMVGLFLLGGIVGTEVALGIFYIALGWTINLATHVRVLMFNLVLSVIFGSVSVLYFTLRERAQRLGMALKEKELSEERLTRLKTKAELEALQTKVNPHFLFNTLNSIASLISENPKAAEETVEKLSELFRHSLRHTEKNTVTVAEEFDLIRTYLEIEKVRLGDRLQYEVKCEDRVRDAELPAMLIQPLVENSIKHGIAPKIGGGRILVEAKESNGTCVITVRDNGRGFQNAGEASGFGLRSIQDRLRLLYGEKASLEIVQNGQSEIIITFPLR